MSSDSEQANRTDPAHIAAHGHPVPGTFPDSASAAPDPSSALASIGPSGSSGEVRVIWVPPQHVFNLPLFESFFVIDTRTQDAFTRGGHALSAINVPCDLLAVTPIDQHASVIHKAIADTIESIGAPERWSPVVIFHDDTDARSEAAAAAVVRVIAEARAMAAKRMHKSPTKPTLRTWYRNLTSVREVWRVKGGARAFADQYAPLAFGTRVSLEAALPSPRHMTHNVFLGSRAMSKLPREVLQGLGIRRAIVASSFATEHAIEAVEYLACDVEDSNYQDMTTCWQSTNTFLDAAERAGERVLIFLHGRSRSASVLLAWLMHREPGLSFEAAWARVADPKFGFHADRRLVFEQQLRRLRTLAIGFRDD